MVKALNINVEASLSSTDYCTTFANDLRARITWCPACETVHRLQCLPCLVHEACLRRRETTDAVTVRNNHERRHSYDGQQ